MHRRWVSLWQCLQIVQLLALQQEVDTVTVRLAILALHGAVTVIVNMHNCAMYCSCVYQ